MSLSVLLSFTAAILLVLPESYAANVFPRYEVNTIMTLPSLSKQRDLLVLSLRAALDLSPDDPRSFYQIGGIHGSPAKPYMNVTNQTSPYSNVTAASRWMVSLNRNRPVPDIIIVVA